MALIKIKQVEDLNNQLTNLADSITDAGSDALVAAASLDTILSTALSGDISDAQSIAISTAGDLDTALSTALSGDISDAQSIAISTAGDLDTALSTALSGDISDAESAAISHADDLDDAMDTRVTTIENTILADDEFRVEEFAAPVTTADTNFTVTVAEDVQNDRAALVWAFVNGVRVTVVSAVAKLVTLNAAYDVDADDVVTIQYQSIDTGATT